MKKLLFSLAIFASMMTVNAQSVIWMDDFEDQDISDWTLMDEDGDGFNFIPYDPSIAQTGEKNYMSSQSYDFDFGPLTPDNWAVSPAINVTNVANLSLSYLVGAQDPDYADETYTVYVATGNTIDDFLNSEVSFSENIGDDPNLGELVERTLDLSSFDGEETIYIAFRHHDSEDMFYINFDDVTVLGDETAGVADLNKATSTVYPNPVVESFNVNLSAKFNSSDVKVTITDMTGKEVKSFGTASSYNVSDLAAGVYVVKITDGKNTETKKIVKK
jgi:hypothetical protein